MIICPWLTRFKAQVVTAARHLSRESSQIPCRRHGIGAVAGRDALSVLDMGFNVTGLGCDIGKLRACEGWVMAAGDKRGFNLFGTLGRLRKVHGGESIISSAKGRRIC